MLKHLASVCDPSKQAHTRKYTDTHRHTHTHTHSHTHTHTHTHTHARTYLTACCKHLMRRCTHSHTYLHRNTYSKSHKHTHSHTVGGIAGGGSSSKTEGAPRLNARQRRTLRRAKERAIRRLIEAGHLVRVCVSVSDWELPQRGACSTMFDGSRLLN